MTIDKLVTRQRRLPGIVFCVVAGAVACDGRTLVGDGSHGGAGGVMGGGGIAGTGGAVLAGGGGVGAGGSISGTGGVAISGSGGNLIVSGLGGAGFSGLGGASFAGAGGSGGAAGACGPDAAPGAELVSDFESGEAVVLPQGSPPRSGRWRAYNDGLGGCMETPPADVVDVAAAAIEGGGRCGSRYALRFFGSSCQIFAGVIADLGGSPPPGTTDAGAAAPPKKLHYDLSGYKQLRFFARNGASAVPKTQTIHVMLPTAWETTVADGGDCALSEIGADRCSASYGRFVAVTQTWQEVVVDLDPNNRTTGISQETWGHQFVWDPTAVLSIAFQTAASVNFDVWIDDIRLVPR